MSVIRLLLVPVLAAVVGALVPAAAVTVNVGVIGDLKLCPNSHDCDAAAYANLGLAHARSGDAAVVGAAAAARVQAAVALGLVIGNVTGSSNGGQPSAGVKAFVDAMRAPFVPVVIGGGRSAVTAPLAATAGSFDCATLSYVSTATSLTSPGNDVFARTIPSDTLLGAAMAAFSKEMGWLRVALLTLGDDAYGTSISTAISNECLTAGVALAADPLYLAGAPGTITLALRKIRDSGARVILATVFDQDADNVFFAAEALGMAGAGTGYTWVMTDAFVDPVSQSSNATRLRSLIHGVVALRPAEGNATTPAVVAALAAWRAAKAADMPPILKIASDAHFATRVPWSLALFAYDAAWLACLALAEEYLAKNAAGTPVTAASDLSGRALWKRVVALNFTGATGLVSLQSDGNRDITGAGAVSEADVHNFWTSSPTSSTLVGRVRPRAAAEADRVRLSAPMHWVDGTSLPPSDGFTCPPRHVFSRAVRRCVVAMGVVFDFTQGPNRQPRGAWVYRRLGALLWALHDINTRTSVVLPPALLASLNPELRIEAIFKDTNRRVAQALNGALELYGATTAGHVASVVASISSGMTASVAPLSQSFSTAITGISSTSPVLSDKESFPTVTRTVPPDSITAAAAAHIMVAAGFKRCAIIAVSDAYGTSYAATFAEEATSLGVDVAATALFSDETEARAAVRRVDATHARVVLLVTFESTLHAIMDEARRSEMLGVGFAWFVTDSVEADVIDVPAASADLGPQLSGFVRILAGGVPNPRAQALRAAWAASDAATWNARYPGGAFQDNGLGVLPNDTFALPLSDFDLFAYDAVVLSAIAYNASLAPVSGKPGAHPAIISGEAVLAALKYPNSSFLGASGEVALNPVTGDRLRSTVAVSIQNWVFDAAAGALRTNDRGTWNPGTGTVWTGTMVWPGDVTAVPDDGSNCGPGYLYDGRTGPCRPCTPGTYLDPRTLLCEACKPGSFAPTEAMTGCVACDELGGFTARVASTACEQCPANSVRAVGTPGVNVTECTCTHGFYSPTGRSGVACEPCPHGAICPGGTRPPHPKVGFWSPKSQPRALFPCYTPTDRCAGGPEHACSPAYTGNRCIECADGYFGLAIACLPCPDGQGWRVMATLFGTLVVLGMWVGLNAVSAGNFDTLDVALLYSQMVALIQQYPLPSTDLLRPLEIVFAAANFDAALLGPHCVMSWDYTNGSYLQLMLPVVAAAFLALMQGVAHAHVWLRYYLDTEWSVVGMPRDHAALGAAKRAKARQLLSLLVVMYNTLAIKSFESFVCDELEDGTRLLRAGPDVVCGSDEHVRLQVAGALGILAYVIGIPAGIAYILWYGHKHDMLADKHYQESFGFVWGRYEPTTSWFELALLGRRVMLCVGVALLAFDPTAQVIAGTVTLLICIVLGAQFNPFISSRIDTLDETCLVSTFMYLFMGVLAASIDSPRVQTTLSVFRLIVTFATVGLCVSAFWSDLKESRSSSKAMRLMDRKSPMPVMQTESRHIILRKPSMHNRGTPQHTPTGSRSGPAASGAGSRGSRGRGVGASTATVTPSGAIDSFRFTSGGAGATAGAQSFSLSAAGATPSGSVGGGGDGGGRPAGAVGASGTTAGTASSKTAGSGVSALAAARHEAGAGDAHGVAPASPDHDNVPVSAAEAANLSHSAALLAQVDSEVEEMWDDDSDSDGGDSRGAGSAKGGGAAPSMGDITKGERSRSGKMLWAAASPWRQTLHQMLQASAAVSDPELHKTLDGRPLLAWARDATPKEIAKYRTIDLWLRAVVSDDSLVGVYAHSPLARFYRSLVDSFPYILDWLLESDETQRREFANMARRMQACEARVGTAGRLSKLVVFEDKSALVFWLGEGRASERKRRAFHRLLLDVHKRYEVQENARWLRRHEVLAKVPAADPAPPRPRRTGSKPASMSSGGVGTPADRARRSFTLEHQAEMIMKQVADAPTPTRRRSQAGSDRAGTPQGGTPHGGTPHGGTPHGWSPHGVAPAAAKHLLPAESKAGGGAHDAAGDAVVPMMAPVPVRRPLNAVPALGPVGGAASGAAGPAPVTASPGAAATAGAAVVAVAAAGASAGAAPLPAVVRARAPKASASVQVTSPSDVDADHAASPATRESK